MNDSAKYIKRYADATLKFKLENFGGVLIVGPKSCGKTTTAERFSKSAIKFEDEDKRDLYLSVAKDTPSLLLKGEKPVLIDEWQDAPKIWGAVRNSIDGENKNGLYILTGSTSREIDTPHTGTGRISRMVMLPMSLYESGESNGSVSLKDVFENKEIGVVQSSLTMVNLIFALCRGGWPRSLMATSDLGKLAIAEDIFNQIVNKDVGSLEKKKVNKEAIEKLLRSYARNIATIASKENIFKDINSTSELISKPTFYDYIESLKNLFVIEDIPAWCPAIRSKKVIRASEKRNFIDPSIAVAAMGLAPEYFYKDFKTLGFLFESMCIRDLKIYSSLMNGKISYYRDIYGLEVDCVLHLKDGRYGLIEFKLGNSEIDKGAEHLNKVEELIKVYNEKEKYSPLSLPSFKMIITGSNLGLKRSDGVYVVPIGCLKD